MGHDNRMLTKLQEKKETVSEVTYAGIIPLHVTKLLIILQPQKCFLSYLERVKWIHRNKLDVKNKERIRLRFREQTQTKIGQNIVRFGAWDQDSEELETSPSEHVFSAGRELIEFVSSLCFSCFLEARR